MQSKKIVLTGGPCAGKTTIAQVISVAFSEQLVVLPESATLIYRGGFPRWPESESLKAIQRVIFRVQKELETIYPLHFPQKKIFMMDRGTVDGAAYWTEGQDSYFREMESSLEAEYRNYDRVIYLASIGESLYLENTMNNPTRNETWFQAEKLDRAVRALWAKHPGFIEVPSHPSFQDRVNRVIQLIQAELSS